MGQYFYTVNLDKKQYLHPHKFGSGLKLTEFSSDACGLPQALCLLLATDRRDILGSWAGDRIVVVGDYADNKYGVTCEDSLYSHIRLAFTDISDVVIEEMKACHKWHPLHQLDMTTDDWRKFSATDKQG